MQFSTDASDIDFNTNAGNVNLSSNSGQVQLSAVHVNFPGLQVFADNAAAIAGGLVQNDLYRNGADPDLVCVVH